MDSADRMDTIINESLSPEEVNALMGVEQPQAAPEGPPPVWPDVEKLDPDAAWARSCWRSIRRPQRSCCRSFRPRLRPMRC